MSVWHAPARPESALVLIGHGSTENEDSSEPIHAHARALRDARLFAEVHCCFWKEEPSLREIWAMIQARDIYLVPDFISEGYFTRTVLPRELELTGPITENQGRTLRYCDPVGTHPSMAALLRQRAQEIAPDVSPAEVSLLLVGHGTALHDDSLATVAAAAAEVAAETPYAQVLATSMEEEPKIENWAELATTDTVVVVPFFISDGLHSYQDIPVLLGIEEETGLAASRRAVFRHNPRQLRGKTLYYSPAIGTHPQLPQIILDQCAAFDSRHAPAAATLSAAR